MLTTSVNLINREKWNIDLVFLAKLNLFQKVNIYYNEDHVTNLSRFSFVPTVQLYVS